MRFVDTNILLYSISSAPAEAEKRMRAVAILDADDLALSAQVLQEFYVQAVHPNRPVRLSHAQAAGLVESWLRWPTQEITGALVFAAIATKDRYQISYRDAAIIEAARDAGCKQVLSEDLNYGQNFNGVQVINPFL